MLSKVLSTLTLAASALAIAGGNLPDQLNGPEADKDQKIAIIGGGPAGLHMAHLLKQRGFEKVRIFEADDLVGGKSKSFSRTDLPDGIRLDAGSVYMLGDQAYTSFHEVLDYVDMEDELTAPTTAQVTDPLLGPLLGGDIDVLDFATWAAGRAYIMAPESDRAVFDSQYNIFCGAQAVLGCDPAASRVGNPFYEAWIKLYLAATTGAWLGQIGETLGPDMRYLKHSIPSFPSSPEAQAILAGSLQSFIERPVSEAVQQAVSAKMAADFGFPVVVPSCSFMRPLFEIYMTDQGYGAPEVTPAYYGISWMTAGFIDVIQRRLAGGYVPPDKNVALVNTGVASVFEELVEVDELDVQVAHEVFRVKKIINPNKKNFGRFKIKSYKRSTNPDGSVRRVKKRYVADFVVSAIDQRIFADLLKERDFADLKDEMNAITSCMIANSWRISDAQVKYPDEFAGSTIYGLGPINAALAAAKQGIILPVQGNVGLLGQVDIKLNKTNEEFAAGPAVRDAVIYELNPVDDNIDLSSLASEVQQIYETRTFDNNYFLRSLDFTQCSPWQWLPLQGRDNIWFVGGTVGFESVEGVLDYNNFIVESWNGFAL